MSKAEFEPVAAPFPSGHRLAHHINKKNRIIFYYWMLLGKKILMELSGTVIKSAIWVIRDISGISDNKKLL